MLEGEVDSTEDIDFNLASHDNINARDVRLQDCCRLQLDG